MDIGSQLDLNKSTGILIQILQSDWLGYRTLKFLKRLNMAVGDLLTFESQFKKKNPDEHTHTMYCKCRMTIYSAGFFESYRLIVLGTGQKEQGGWAGAFRNVVVRKPMTHPFQLEQNGVTHP